MSSSDVDASLIVTTGWFRTPTGCCTAMLIPLGQYSVVIPEAAAPSRHYRNVRRQLLKHVGHHGRRHSLGALADRRGRNAIAAQHAPRIDPAAFVVDLTHGHAANIRAVQAMQPDSGVRLLDLGDDALEAGLVVGLAEERDLDAVAQAGLGHGKLDQHLPRLRRQELL